ncbi:hypothetical protein Csa_022807 [Cucumis sativus]|uniref:Uncharacterized protein n=1 Tax=Cucumis sativus TaxID=3659 RepID=A0A0A0LVT7_CUCSA|nr:hypothetical protein Csa_022807 [Cucumis sativus]
MDNFRSPSSSYLEFQASSPSLRCFTFAINALCLLNLKEKQVNCGLPLCV